MKRWLGRHKRHPARWLGLMLGSLALVAAPAIASTLSQGYKTADPLPAGSLVGLDATSNNGAIRAANTDRAGELIGVVVAADSTSLSVSGGSTNVQVVTSGTAIVLVSSINGAIKKGDAVTVSPINGVGMRATSAGRILGLAQSDFSNNTADATTQSIDSKTGKQQVALGSIPVSISVGYFNPKTDSNAFVPQAVQNLANSLVGKPVSPYRVITAAALLLLGIILVVIILNSAIRSSMESIGRNPLAKAAVNAGLYKIIFLGLLVLLVTLASVYFVVKG